MLLIYLVFSNIRSKKLDLTPLIVTSTCFILLLLLSRTRGNGFPKESSSVVVGIETRASVSFFSRTVTLSNTYLSMLISL